MYFQWEGNKHGTTTLVKCLVVSIKPENTHTLWPTNSIYRQMPNRNVSKYIHQKTCKTMFVVKLVVIIYSICKSRCLSRVVNG